MDILDNAIALQTQRVVSEREAAAFIDLSLPHLRRLRRQGRAPSHIRLSERRLGYRIAALISFLDARTVEQSTGQV